MSRGAKRNMYELQMTVKLSRYPEGFFHYAIDLAGTMLMKLKIHTFNDVKTQIRQTIEKTPFIFLQCYVGIGVF